MNIQTETRDVTTTKTFVSFDESDEFEVPLVIDFLESIMGTDGFMSGLRNLGYSEKQIAEALQKQGIVDHTHSAGWFETEPEQINMLWETLMSEFHNDLEKSELDAKESFR